MASSTSFSQPASSLMQAAVNGEACLGAIFGGQGPHNPHNLEQIRTLWRSHGLSAHVKELFERSSKTLEELACRPHKDGFHDDYGFSFQEWILDTYAAPAPDLLAQAPISFPLNTLLGLVQYCIACDQLASTPGQFATSLVGTTGHSQGIFVAAAVALSDTWEGFWEASQFAIQLSFAVGLESRHDVPVSAVSATEAQASIERGFGEPTPMLSVAGLSAARLDAVIRKVNSKTPEVSGRLYLALENSRSKHVVSGPVRNLWKLSLVLERMRAADGLDQTRVLFSERKPTITMRFLPISSPFHSPYLMHVADRLVNDWGLATSLSRYIVPLVHPLTGEHMTINSSAQLVQSLVEAVTVQQVNWPRACGALNATHVLDFGPGRVGDLVLETSKGRGICVVDMTQAHSTTQPGVLSPYDFYSNALPLRPLDWERAYGPRVSEARDTPTIETGFTKIFGCPPVMVPGMVPTSVSPDFVIAVMKAGYHAELGGGGFSSEPSFEKAVREIASQVRPHRGVTCNILYANPQTVAWQISCLRRLIAEGVPVSGITIGAGVPSEDVVADLVENMGLKHISFKPGSTRAIEQVIAIARRYPRFPIRLQWTGGRAGGHHSFEDFHDVMLAKYEQIRLCSNIILIAGSGFGDGEESWPYVSGSWAAERGYAPMPFDGVLVGSRMMVAQEAHTSPAAKRLITEVPGVEDADWQQSYRQPAGGVVSMISEMGEPMHVIANRGTMLWKHLDEKVFSIRDVTQRAAYLAEHRAEIIARLNADSAKPWFAVNAKGCSVALEDLTYREVISRLCQLTRVQADTRRWINVSYRALVFDFVRLAATRHGVDVRDIVDGDAHSTTARTNIDGNADAIVRAFASRLGAAADEVLWPDDVFRIMALFRRRGQKPVPFVPALDERFETWYKKDSLWQSEHVDAVVGQDVQRVVILHGPVAARFSTKLNEPVGQILDNISQHFVARLSSTTASSTSAVTTDSSATQDSATDAPQASALSTYPGLRISHHNHVHSYLFLPEGELPTGDVFRESLANTTPWLHAALVADRVFSQQTCQWIDNPIRAAMTPGAYDVVQAFESEDSAGIEAVALLSNGGNSNLGTKQSQLKAVLRIDFRAPKTVSVTLTPQVGVAGAQPSVVLEYSLENDQGGARLYDQPDQSLGYVRDLYYQLWLPKRKLSTETIAGDDFLAHQSESIQLSSDLICKFDSVVRRVSPSSIPAWTREMPVPLDACVILAWEGLISPPMALSLRCDFLHLLHQSVDISQYASVRPLGVSDIVKVASRITAISNTGSGRRVEVSADILRGDEAVVNIKTVFFLRGVAMNAGSAQFEEQKVPEYVYQVDTDVREAILKDRKWLHLDAPDLSIRGRALVFRLTRRSTTSAERCLHRLQVAGNVYAMDSSDGLDLVGSVAYETTSENDNVVVDFLRRHGAERHPRKALEQPGWTGPSSLRFNAPVQSKSYALASADFNPIHTCPEFARFAGLPRTVVHGMNTSAIVKRLVRNARSPPWLRIMLTLPRSRTHSMTLRGHVSSAGKSCGRIWS
jgi:fatty acid synthase subunit beta